ncbi:MAG TPA: FadR/GntR family transcriptional regulator [Azoarcus taiwanensis]|uniref:FCD domain-containing protein n=1 Tax=Azoarcus taiwanensis TaxID=666964 RepID=A0A972FEX2_9RHOO|nr:FadR/GntR family transcriptional regulator [Azoarcus taiwanensis]NMG04067.1 FCD domain-containing protein [Azoarcus taiwanensis]HRQ56828.1 FadR/GntR family transcriptional regulator [Azoarcus taiwanensis]
MDADSRLASASRLSDEVARQLEAWILSEGFQVGARLPTEKLLCERFGVSRAVIREAISRLKAEGCIRTRQGSGAYLASLPGEGSFRLVRDGSCVPKGLPREIADVFEMRYIMETGATELAAMRRTASDLERIAEALGRMERAISSGENAVGADDDFHVAIAAATQNPQLERFQVFMGHQLSQSRAPTWDAAGHVAGRAKQAQLEHRRIYQAILAGDRSAARQAAAEHLESGMLRLGLDARGW